MRNILSCIFFTLPTFFACAMPENPIPNIHIDQFGYLPNTKKIAVISNPVEGYNNNEFFDAETGDAYEVRDWFTDDVVFSGQLVSWNDGAMHEQSGDLVWWFDFSNLTSEGSYYVHASEANASSGRFEISPCVYTDVLRQAMRAFFYQRCGMEKNAQFANAAWSDDACHLGVNQDTQCHPYNDNVNGMKDLSGGWHDAGDYNKYVNFAFEPVLDLCEAALYNQDIWNESFNIPESGNGLEDIKDEIKYELDWLLKMQNNDGSVLSMVGTTSYNAATPPSSDVVTRVYGPATTAATFSSAAVFASASFIFTGAYSDQLVAAAENAWNWAVANPNVVFYNSGVIVSGEQQTDTYETWVRQIVAAIHLYHVTNNDVYRQFVDENYLDAHMMQWGYVYPFETALQSALIQYSLMPGSGAGISEDIQTTYINSVSNANADNLPAYLNATDAYLAYMSDQNYTWGSNTTKSRQGMILQNMRMYYLSFDHNYEEAALGYLHYFHGVNPNGICFLTNMSGSGAEKSVNSIYHGWFADGSTLWDEAGTSVYGPVPGLIPGGPNPTYALDDCCPVSCGSDEANALCATNSVTPPMGQPIQKSWRDWNTSWPQNSWTVTEIGIYTQAAYIKLLAQFIGGGCLSSTLVAQPTVQKIGLNIFPNPCNDELVVSTELLQPGVSTLKIFDNTGRILNQTQVTTRSGKSAQIVDTSSLHNGMYLLSIESGGVVRTTRFVVGGR